MDYDDLLKLLGEFGRYQKVVYFMVWFILIPHSIHVNNTVFLVQQPVFRCAVPGMDNDTYDIQNEAHARLLNVSIPFDSKKGQYSQCLTFAPNWNENASNRAIKRLMGCVLKQRDIIVLTRSFTNRTVHCDRWVRDEDKAANSLIPDLGLSCDTKSIKVQFGLALMFGLLVGSSVGGMSADFFGRKKVLLFVVIVHFAIDIAFTFVTSLPLALTFKFLQSALGVAGHMAKFVLIIELIGPRMRGMAAMASILAWSIPMLFIAMVYYVCQDWKTGQIAVTVPFFFCIIVVWMIPESPRWLLVHNRVPEAKKIIARIAEVNKVSIPEDIVDSLKIVNTHHAEKQRSKNERYQMIMKLFSDRTMVIRLIVLCLNWGVVNTTYFGLTFNLSGLSGSSIYLTVLTQGVVETMAYAGCTLSSGWLGRKISYCLAMILGGCACLLIFILGITDSGGRWINLGLFAVGKFGVGAAFTLVYTLTAELVPTASRNFGLGLCSFSGRLCGIAAPYIVNIKKLVPGKEGEVAPLAIFGVISILAGISIYLLPETHNRHLPELIKDIKENHSTRDAPVQEQQEMI